MMLQQIFQSLKVGMQSRASLNDLDGYETYHITRQKPLHDSSGTIDCFYDTYIWRKIITILALMIHISWTLHEHLDGVFIPHLWNCMTTLTVCMFPYNWITNWKFNGTRPTNLMKCLIDMYVFTLWRFRHEGSLVIWNSMHLGVCPCTVTIKDQSMQASAQSIQKLIGKPLK